MSPTSDRPPRWLAAILRWRLPADLQDTIEGDLEHEYRTVIRQRNGRLRSTFWYIGQILSLRGGALHRASARLRNTRPTWDRSRPSTLQHDRGVPSMFVAAALKDLRYAVRRLGKRPGFTAIAVASLALGIGANTAMFSIVNAVLLRDLPIEEPDRVVEVYSSDSNGYPYATSSYLDYKDLRDRNDVFESVVATRTFISRMEVEGQGQVVFGELVSWDFFQSLGVDLALGRPFLEEEDVTPGTHAVTILGHQTWEKEFGGDPDIVGKTVELNQRPFTVIGVAPRSFTASMPVLVSGFYIPMMMTDAMWGSEQLSRRQSRSLFVKARLADGVTLEQANQSLEALSLGLQEAHPETNENRVMSAIPASDVSIHPQIDGALGPVAGLLLMVVGLVLVIACANLASFLLAQAEDRRRDIAVRLALGAGRGRLVRQLLLETTLLGVLGGVAGFFVAQWTVGLLMAFQPPLPVPVDFDITLDRTVLLFTAAVSLAAGVVFGLLPALQATNPDVAPTLKNEATSAGGSKRRINLRGGLVVAQVAFSFVLLIGAGLFLRSLQKAQRIDPGFDTGPAALFWPMPELSGISGDEETEAFFQLAEERLLANPQITHVAMADRLPLGTAVQTQGYILPDVPSSTPDGDHDIDNAYVNFGYFDAMGVSILNGRSFDLTDKDGEEAVVVSQAFVDTYYPGQSMVGSVIQTTGGRQLRLIGVAANTKVRTLGEDPRPYVYHLTGQAVIPGMQVVVRGSGNSLDLLQAGREVMAELNPDLVYFEEPKTMNDHLSLMLFPPRMAAMVLSAFGALALALAGIGVYGVVSYAVAKRTREMGIRLALGATAAQVVRLALRGGMRLVVVGGVVGIGLAAAVTWLLSGYLFGIAPTDVVTFLAIPALLSAVALFAAWVPARRASLVDPVRALRTD